ncbi:MAG: recombinase family protein [Lutispora sp.]|nr:recombinase family protein [Lutispora sp.]
MAKRKVTAIPATINKFTAAPVNSRQKRRVAGYARVSTDHEDQVTSYAAQVDYYTNYIKGRENWEYAGIYTDEGISATNTKKRDGFNRMVADALAGKIDLIITKSVSRFARNTVDSLTTIRKLKEHNVECYFEKENIWTFDSKGELLLTIMSSLAQEESRSISENVTWGPRKRFADGKVSFAYSRVLGLEKGPDGNIVVNQEQAEIVKLIFRRFLEGMTPHSIAAELTDMGIKSPDGKDKWNSATVRRMLSNDKYRRVIYRCNHKFDGNRKCETPHVTEEEIIATFIKAMNTVITERDEIIGNIRLIRQTVCDTTDLTEEQDKLRSEMKIVVELTQSCVAENARTAQNQEEYQKRYDDLVERYEKVKSRYDALAEAIEEKQAHYEKLGIFIQTLEEHGETIAEFDAGMWGSMVEFITVDKDKNMTVTFKDGSEIAVE